MLCCSLWLWTDWLVTLNFYLCIWREVTPGAILTKCRLWGDMVDVITCAIFGDCRLRGVGVVRGVSFPSPIDLTHRPYNTGHTTVTVWFMYLVTQLLLIILQRFLMYHCDCLKNKFHENTAMFEAHLIRANTWTLGIMDCLVCRKVEIFSKHLTFSRVFS